MKTKFQLPLSRSLAYLFGLCLFIGVFCSGCEIPPATTAKSGAPSSDALALSFEGPLRGAFDDGIDVEVFGAPGDRDPAADPRLADRVRAASLVVVVQVTTVTQEGATQSGHLDLELQVVEAPIRGALPRDQSPDEPIHVAMRPGTASYSYVLSNQSDLIGKRIILCLGRFQENGMLVSHWHGLMDAPRVRAAVLSAASVADLEN